MDNRYDVVIVGGGILGTFHAYHALEQGLKVCLLEKDAYPQGATTQNFGQVVPSGMNSKWQKLGRESLRIYKDIQSQFDISIRQNGTVYLASNEEEEQLLVELRAINNNNDYASRMLTKGECMDRYPGLRKEYVKAGLFFPDEVTVEPRTMIHRLQEYLTTQKGLTMKTHFTVVSCERNGDWTTVRSTSNEAVLAKKVIICNGSDFKNLYPEVFAQSDLEVSKLQMMQTKPQKDYSLKGSILTGWSIRRYEAFHECPSFAQVKQNEPADSLQKKWGVHILFKQAMDGSVILGDSHQYADVDKMEDLGYDLDMDIDHFMLEEAKKIMELPTYEIQRRWYGMYSQCKTIDIFQKTIDEHIHIVTGIGGKGMTGSAGFAKKNIATIFNKQRINL
ncbi:TIGR03364 family FAD-dependent oxidoreductase [Flagellimonas taeanensis]|uniref:TIGR03364 family FAD-dependent oxidoreductase n=1 Tax=Flavobacteriaceae TaxID=49546 RepID=UPI000E67F34E|nr:MULTISPECIES: TIGR03364 family FAD-dependent oxidoreductase [Allomuricauda]MDC6383821.1 TIGR03364 family FAD-dependent oxidoreductase [Muricauda sp. SK9]RIV48446.1 TIGR03364 family FAD-dependent oxidoreductase [Allomuricauda taeanensis]